MGCFKIESSKYFLSSTKAVLYKNRKDRIGLFLSKPTMKNSKNY